MAMGLQEKHNIEQDYTEVVMHIGLDNLKLVEIKEWDRSKEKGYPVKEAHNEGKGKSYIFLLCEGFDVGLWGVKWTETLHPRA